MFRQKFTIFGPADNKTLHPLSLDISEEVITDFFQPIHSKQVTLMVDKYKGLRDKEDVGQIFARIPRVEVVEEAVEVDFSADEALEEGPERPVHEVVVDAEVLRVMIHGSTAVFRVSRHVYVSV